MSELSIIDLEIAAEQAKKAGMIRPYLAIRREIRELATEKKRPTRRMTQEELKVAMKDVSDALRRWSEEK